MNRLRTQYEAYKFSGLIDKAEYMLHSLDLTLKVNCDGCNSNEFEHECLVDGTVSEKLRHCRDILIRSSFDTEIESTIDVAMWLTKNKEKLSDIRDVYDFEDIENPDVNFSVASSVYSLPDIVHIDDSDSENTPINLPSTSTTSSYNVPLQQKSKFGKMLSTKRGKSSEKVRKELFAVTPYVNGSNKSDNGHSFHSLGHKLRLLNLEYHELSLNKDFILNNNGREKQAIALVISRLNQSEDLHTYIEHTSVKDPLKIEFEKKEAELKLELQQSKRSMEDVITCSVCLERQKSKTLVPCGHSYCLQCSKKLTKYGKKCAICRSEFDQVIPMFC